MDTQDHETERRVGVIEQHIGTIVQVVIAGTLVWIGSTVVDMRSQIAVLQERIVYLTQRASQLDEVLGRRDENTWTRKDQDVFSVHVRDRLNTLDNRLNGHGAAIDDLRRRIERAGVK